MKMYLILLKNNIMSWNREKSSNHKLIWERKILSILMRDYPIPFTFILSYLDSISVNFHRFNFS
jgi:hypothetical protein